MVPVEALGPSDETHLGVEIFAAEHALGTGPGPRAIVGVGDVRERTLEQFLFGETDHLAKAAVCFEDTTGNGFGLAHADRSRFKRCAKLRFAGGQLGEQPAVFPLALVQAQQGPRSRDQLFGLYRFGQISVRAALQASYAVRGGDLERGDLQDHDCRAGGIVFDGAAYVQAVDVRQFDVEQNQLRAHFRHQL